MTHKMPDSFLFFPLFLSPAIKGKGVTCGLGARRVFGDLRDAAAAAKWCSPAPLYLTYFCVMPRPTWGSVHGVNYAGVSL